jgi:hypothetical protein
MPLEWTQNGLHTHQAFGRFIGNGIQTVKPDLADNPIEDLANVYADATWRRVGVDERLVKRVFKTVHDRQAHDAFDQAVAQLARLDGYTYADAQAVLQAKWSSNMVSQAFNRAPLKEAADIYHQGVNPHRASPWEYRLRGFWLSLGNFMAVCRRYPLMSTLVIAATGYLGGKYPFLGGVSGLAIIGAAGAGIATNEHAAKTTANAKQKAHYYMESGENLSALVLTASGIDGILAGTWQGVKAMQAPLAVKRVQMLQWPERLWNGIKMTMPGGHHMGPRFVLGLLDNVLMPFNSLAKKLQHQDNSRHNT